MAGENEDGQERTEEPSEKRLAEARERGQVPRSRELAAAAVFGAMLVVLLGLGGHMAGRAADWMRGALTLEPRRLDDPAGLTTHFAHLLAQLLLALSPLVIAGVLAALAAPALMGGFHFSGQALKPDFSRLDPVAGLRRLWGRESLAELLKSLLRVLFIAGLAASGVWQAAPRLIALVHEPLPSGLADGLAMVLHTLVLMTAGLVLLAAIDAPYQRWSHRQKLMMTRQELRDELKETEGRPEVKSRIRRLQQQLSRRRMIEDVPRADVVLVNPTHYAVALRYEAGRTRAPVVVAKGVDEIARVIRETAERHAVPVMSAPPLARALYRQVDIGREIPADLYKAVAQILGYIYQLRAWRQHGGKIPERPTLDMPEDGE